MGKQLNKNLLECNNKTECGEIFYVLNDAESERIPEHCPFCGCKDVKDFVPANVNLEETDDESD